MQHGVVVTGTVTASDGSPVEGAMLVMGEQFGGNAPKPITNGEGRYRFTNAKPGQTEITVLAEGHAPEMRVLEVGPNISPLDFQHKDGKTIRVRVVDKDGKPIVGASVVPDTWRGARTLVGNSSGVIPRLTDNEGRFEWTWAPGDEIQYDIYTKNHMRVREQAMVPRDEEYVVTMYRMLKVSGRVVDAKTKEPIKSFRVVPGIQWGEGNNRSWSRSDVKEGKFVLERVPPDMIGTVAQQVIQWRRGGTMSSSHTQGKPISTFAGDTIRLTLGGVGRPVIGRFVLPEGDDREVDDWNFGHKMLQLQLPGDDVDIPGIPRPRKPWYSFRIQKDGTFRVEDLPEGEFELQVHVYKPRTADGRWDRGDLIGSHHQQFKIDAMPGGRSDEPFDLGDLELSKGR